jgi:type I restriction enzyme S subunit
LIPFIRACHKDCVYEQIIISLGLVKITPTFPSLLNFIHVSYLSSPEFKNHAFSYVNGTTVLHLSKKALPEYEITLPNDKTIIEQANGLIEPLYRQIATNIEESAYLAALRDILLPRLVTG